MLKLDYSYMLADVVGSKLGLTEQEIAAIQPRAAGIHARLQVSRHAGDLPFYGLPLQSGVDDIVALADGLADRFDALVVLGIGGSALGATAVSRALLPLTHNLLDRKERNDRPRLFVLDNVDPVGIKSTLDLLDPAKTCFCVISKSGTTVETMSQFLVATEWVKDGVGDCYREHFCLITDPEHGVLRKLANEEAYTCLEVPAGVGGRFSVFTPVGLLPLAVAGVDIKGMLAGAAQIRCQCLEPDLLKNPAYLNATLQYLCYKKGASVSVMMPYSDRLRDISDWYRQLWAESLGKRFDLDGNEVYVGPTPAKALGVTDQHSQLQLYMEGPYDKVITFLSCAQVDSVAIPASLAIPEIAYLGGQDLGTLLASEQKATAVALARAGRPNCTIELDAVTPESIGALLYLFQVQTVFAGGLFGVDPLDQPGVEAGKVITSALMGKLGSEKERESLELWENRVESKVLHLTGRA